MVFLLDSLEKLQEQFPLLYTKLSEQRKEKVDRLRFAEDKLASACAFLLLRILLSEQRNYFEMPIFTEAEGKPQLRVRNDICWNLAHDRKGVACVLSDGEVGCDIQEIFPYEKSLAERVLSARERATVIPTRSSEKLTRIWSIKESYGKCIGDGVYSHLEDTDFSACVEDGVYRYQNFTITSGKKGNLVFAVCGQKEEEVKWLTPSEFLEKVSRL